LVHVGLVHQVVVLPAAHDLPAGARVLRALGRVHAPSPVQEQVHRVRLLLEAELVIEVEAEMEVESETAIEVEAEMEVESETAIEVEMEVESEMAIEVESEMALAQEAETVIAPETELEMCPVYLPVII
jgi:hypothetical protein